MIKLKIILITLYSICCFFEASACTIFCAKDVNNQIWVGNNEDQLFTFHNYLNVFPKTTETSYGYYTLSYHSEENGQNWNIQGGMNEAGLFYDFNVLNGEFAVKDLGKKEVFPGGDQKILSHILANMSTTDEVVSFFEKYWFYNGFKNAQMHVADKNGDYAIIGPSGIKELKNEPFSLTTNFDICGDEDSSSCWRYPIALDALQINPIGIESFTEICSRTAQTKEATTIYSNIQNLNTGDIWFYFALDYTKSYKTNIKDLLANGRKGYLIRNLFPECPATQVFNTYKSDGISKAYDLYKSIEIPEHQRLEIESYFVYERLNNYMELDVYPFLIDHLKSNPIGHWMRTSKALWHYFNGDTVTAVNIIENYKKEVPETSMDVNGILNKFKGNINTNFNTRFELNGHQDAKYVFVTGIPGGIHTFLIKKNGSWVGSFELSEGTYNFAFLVDGKRVLDKYTPVLKLNPTEKRITHQVIVGSEKLQYPITITVEVPNPEDVVYIAGNKNELANWTSNVRMEKSSAHLREITLPLDLPLKFKFTRGNWTSEAILEGNIELKSHPEIQINSLKDVMHFKIVGWAND